ncbi:Nucleic-acid-binding protein from transposon X-element [Eumeta japonica]|uniref:Nucleic-acid-binding protein from transposon X-element n=1 Tax=Eumeta variegata TaxID=151549 RepID=A0A4C1W0W6_EUMVA|nr:Nucleic-acid-binding protein from transposon X-element [Eumeta japonica]
MLFRLFLIYYKEYVSPALPSGARAPLPPSPPVEFNLFRDDGQRCAHCHKIQLPVLSDKNVSAAHIRRRGADVGRTISTLLFFVCAEPHRVKYIATSYTSFCRGNLTVATTGTCYFDNSHSAATPSPAGSRRALCARRVPPYVARFAAYRTAIRVPRVPLYLFDLTRAPARAPRGRRVASPAERGHLDLLREFEAYCTSPASPDPHPQVVVFDPEMDVEFTLPREPKKRPATVRPSEGTTSDSESSDTSDHSDFTTVRRRKASKASERKPEASYLTQAPDGSTYFRITPSSKKPKKANIAEATASTKTRSIDDSPVSWRTPSQPTTASQGAVDAGKTKAAAPAAAKNSISDEADVTAPPTPAPRGPKPPPMFVQNKDRWTELRKKCADNNIQFSQARNSAQGLKLQAKTIADFRNLQNLLVTLKISFHTYSLKEEQEIRVVLRGVPKELPVDEVKEDLLAQNLPVQSVRRILNRFREPLDLVLVSGTAEANDKATKAAFFKIRSVCSLSGVKAEQPRKRALPGQCHNCQSYGHLSRYCFRSARCVKCLGDHGTAQCTRNKDTDGPPACVLCKQKGHTANYLGCPRAPKRAPPPEKAAPCRAPARAVSSTLSYARAAAGPRNAPPAAKNNPTSADGLSQLMSIITVIDTSELAILAKKFRTAANPTEKLISLIEHASLVEAIKNKL